MSTGTLLGVWAHPDDETYLSAGLMAAARRNGERVVVLTATAGELGTDDPQRWPPHRLAARRRRELRAALSVLGVAEHALLGFPDGGCAEHDGTDLVAATIERVRPDTIVTFGPDGMTGHPDHRAVSAWTTAAWEATGRAARLWYATLTPAFHDEWGPLGDRLGMWGYGASAPCTPQERLAASVRLDGVERERKLAALREHASQTDALVAQIGAATLRDWWSTEAFVEAQPVLSARS